MKLRTDLFCYGTLMYAPVMCLVCGAVPPMEAVTLPDYVRLSVSGKPFPGVICKPGSVVHGVLYHGLTPRQLQQLDAYESDFYQRVQVRVTTARGAWFPAAAYIISPHTYNILNRHGWEPQRFARYFLPRYLAQLRRGVRVT